MLASASPDPSVEEQKKANKFNYEMCGMKSTVVPVSPVQPWALLLLITLTCSQKRGDATTKHHPRVSPIREKCVILTFTKSQSCRLWNTRYNTGRRSSLRTLRNWNVHTTITTPFPPSPSQAQCPRVSGGNQTRRAQRSRTRVDLMCWSNCC